MLFIEFYELNKIEKMTAKEYLSQIGFDDAHLCELFNNDDKSYYQIAEIMEEYHQSKLKLLGIADVVGQSEQLVCSECGDTGVSYPTLQEPGGVECEKCKVN